MGAKWELTVVENVGEIEASSVRNEIAVETKPLLIDIKAQLMIAMPKSLKYTIGWRAIVWQEKETGRFQDLTDDEYKKYLSGDRITYSRSNGKSDKQDEPTE